MEWSSKFATGFDEIDRQHKRIFKMVAEYRDALDAGHGERVYGDFLKFLGVYVRAHFAKEESCMEVHQCSVASVNVREHAKMIKELAAFQQRFGASGFVRSDAYELAAFVDQWLAGHICRIDVKLQEFGSGRPRPVQPSESP